MDNTLTPQTKKMIIKSAAVLITVILLGIVGFGSIRTVGAGEVGIITRFGEVNRVAESGLTFKIPFIEGSLNESRKEQLRYIQQNRNNLYN